jgi:hypothetical protein
VTVGVDKKLGIQKAMGENLSVKSISKRQQRGAGRVRSRQEFQKNQPRMNHIEHGLTTDAWAL